MIVDEDGEKINENTDEPFTPIELAFKWIRWGLNECADWENIMLGDEIDKFTPEERKAVNDELDTLRSILGRHLNDME